MQHKRLPFHLQFELNGGRSTPPPHTSSNNPFSAWNLSAGAAAQPPVNTRIAGNAAAPVPSSMSTTSPPTVPAAASPKVSEEQSRIVQLLRKRTHNLVVNSVAGAGKTTCVVFTVQQLLADLVPGSPVPTFHLITYNANLKLDTRERLVALGLDSCTSAQSYHSHAVRHLAPQCFDDRSLQAALDRGSRLDKLPADGVHILFLDEVQDQTLLYYRYVCTLLRDLATVVQADGQTVIDPARYPVLAVLGDSRQNIFGFNGADERFLELAPQLFSFTGRPWAAPTLTTSYRLTHPVAQFVNHVMLRLPIEENEEAEKKKKKEKKEHLQMHGGVERAAMGIGIRSERRHITLPPPSGRVVPAPKPRYLVCNAFGEDVFRELKYYLDMGYGPGDIFVVAPSVASDQSPIRRLENTVKQRLPHLQLFVTSGKEERLDKDVLEGKLVFATMHQTKGLGRPVVIVLGFDDAYFRFMARDLDPLRCANVLYVAATRSAAHLSLVQHNKNGPLPFLDAALLARFAVVRQLAPSAPPAGDRGGGASTVAVSKLTEHVPAAVLEAARLLLGVRVIRPARAALEIVNKTQQDKGVENVSAITGTAVPAYFELQRTGRMTIYDRLLDANFEQTIDKGGDRGGRRQTSGIVSSSSSSSSSSSGLVQWLLGRPSSHCTKNGGDKKEEATASSFMGDDDDGEEEDATSGSTAATAAGVARVPLADWEKPFHLESISLRDLSPAELLYIANCHNANESHFLHKVYQIKTYDWLTEGMLKECAARLESLGIGPRPVFESSLPEVRNRVEMFGRSLVGCADCLDESGGGGGGEGGGGCLYEFKFVSALTTEHVLQLALYLYMHNSHSEDRARYFYGGSSSSSSSSLARGRRPIRGQLYNIRTDELWELDNDPAALVAVVRLLCEAKFSPKIRVPDAEFLKAAEKVRQHLGLQQQQQQVPQPVVEDDEEAEFTDDEYVVDVDPLPKRMRRGESITVLRDAPEDLYRRSQRLAGRDVFQTVSK